MQYAVGVSLRPFYSQVEGDFYAEYQFAGVIDIELARPIGSVDKDKLMLNSTALLVVDNIEVMAYFDTYELQGYRILSRTTQCCGY